MIACHLSEENLGCAVLTSCVKSLCALGALQMLTKACQLSAIGRRFKQFSRYSQQAVTFAHSHAASPLRLCSLITFKRYIS